MLRWYAVLVVSLPAMACTPEEDSVADNEEDEEIGEVSVGTPGDDSSAVAGLLLTGRETEPITANTTAGRESLAELLPGYEVRAERDELKGDEYVVYRIRREGELALEVRPQLDESVGLITVHSPDFQTAPGIAVSSSFAEVTDAEDDLTCLGRAGDSATHIDCFSTGRSYAFDVGSDAYQGDEIPSDQQDVILGEHAVELINVHPN